MNSGASKSRNNSQFNSDDYYYRRIKRNTLETNVSMIDNPYEL